MIDFTAAEVAAAVGGELSGLAPDVVISSISLDSRAILPGDLFVAIVGQTHDAHDYASAAMAHGAVAVLVSRDVAQPSIIVGDTTEALGRLARSLLDRLPACMVVAITGSSGKTSTKDLIASVLATAGPTVAPPGSFNNEIGLPTTVLRADAATRFLVMEMGMRGPGHIAYLCQIAPPSVAVVTNVGSAHIELLGSQQAIADAKAELVQSLPSTGIAVLNADDSLVAAMAESAPADVITFGVAPGSNIRAANVVLDDLARATFDLVVGSQTHPVTLQLHGIHHVSNALAAAATAIAVGMSVPDVAAALNASTASSRWRMELSHTANGAIVVNDAYNANPESMTAALASLAAMSSGRRSWAVLGEMREIGDTSVEQHLRVGQLAAELGIDRVVIIGEGARPIFAGAEPLLGQNARWVPDTATAIELLEAELGPNDIVLVKASRAIALERVANALLQQVPGKDSDL